MLYLFSKIRTTTFIIEPINSTAFPVKIVKQEIFTFLPKAGK